MAFDRLASVLGALALIVLCASCVREGTGVLAGDRGTGEPAPTPTGTATPGPPDGFVLPVTIRGIHVHAPLRAFPVWVQIVRPELRNAGHGGHVLFLDGSDLLFVTEQGRVLPHEIVEYDPVAGRLGAWVHIHSAPAGVDTTFHLRYGVGDLVAERLPPSWVWTDGFAAVWHLESVGDNDFGSVPDSTMYEVHGRDRSSVPAVPGAIGRAAAFASDNHHVLIDNSNLPLGFGGLNAGFDSFSLQAWFRRTSAVGTWDTIFEKGLTEVPAGWGLYLDRLDPGNETLALWIGTQSFDGFQGSVEVPFAPQMNEWYHVVVSVDRSIERVSFYVDGAPIGTRDVLFELQDESFDTTEDSALGNNTATTNCCPIRGHLDEIFVSAVTRSPAWVRTTYENQADPTSFLAVGTEAAY